MGQWMLPFPKQSSRSHLSHVVSTRGPGFCFGRNAAFKFSSQKATAVASEAPAFLRFLRLARATSGDGIPSIVWPGVLRRFPDWSMAGNAKNGLLPEDDDPRGTLKRGSLVSMGMLPHNL
jgi:hypothetical protein